MEGLVRYILIEKFSSSSLNVLPRIRLYTFTYSQIRMKFLSTVTFLSALLFWAGCSTMPKDQTFSDPSPAPLIVTQIPKGKKNLVFPRAIAGIPFKDMEVYEADHPGYGVGYLYENEFTKLDISIFDGGLASIGDGILSDGVHLQYEEAKEQIAAIEEKGYYKIVRVDTDDWIQVGDRPFLYFSYTFDNGYEEKSSYLMLTAYDGNFLKIRLTTDLAPHHIVLDAFISEFEELISSETTS